MSARRRRVLSFPKFDPKKFRHGRQKGLDSCAIELLQTADRLWDISRNVDTAVGDSMLKGMAYLVEAAFDCHAMSLGLEDAAFPAFIETSTAEWFRERGCAEWFCLGAGAMFHVSRPRTKAERNLNIKTFKRSPGRKKKAVA